MSCALIGLLESCLAALLMTSFTFPSFTLSLVKEKKKTKFSCNFCLFFFNADSNDGMCAWLYAASNAAKILEGEMCRMTLSRPKNGNAQHLRAVSIVPLRSGFKPAIESLKEFYGVKPATS
jgi:hypothetical protein